MEVEFGFYQIQSAKYDGAIPDCEVIKWHKKVGDRVEKGEPLLDFEAEKVSDNVLESPFSGTIVSIKERYLEGSDKEGRTWVWNNKNREFESCGVIIHLLELGYIETDDVDEAPSAETAKDVKRLSTTEEEAEPENVEPSNEASSKSEEPKRVLAAPASRTLAREAGIDINIVEGTGMGGRVMKADVERAINEINKEQKSEIEEREELDDREPLKATQMRKAIAYYLKKSHEEVVKAGDSITVDVTNLWKFYRQRRESWREDTGTDFSMTGLFMFLATRLLHDQREKFGIINAYWDKDEAEGYLFKHVNIGIAIQASEGLMVPVMHGAETLSFREFMAQVDDKVKRAMSKKITLPELHDLTFTVNNVGAKGGENPDSIVPYIKESSGKERPTGMIMVLGAIKKFPDDKFIAELVRLGVIESKSDFDIRTLMTLAFSFDHRLFDGVPALEFVGVIKKYIEEKDDPEEFRELFDENFTIK